MFDPVEEILKEVLKKKKGLPLRTADCPTERELWDYLRGAAHKELEEKISDHVVQCDFCLESLLLAQEVQPGIGFDPSRGPSSELFAKVTSFTKKRTASKPALKSVWLFLSLLSIGVSFIFPNYFFQCLVLGTIFGLKWVFDTATNRTLIVMYDTLTKKSRKEEETLKRL